MIGRLPTSLKLSDTDFEIRTDFRNCLLILSAYDDPELDEIEKMKVLVSVLYKTEIPAELTQEAISKAMWFLNKGEPQAEHKVKKPKVFDWQQDENLIFSGINKIVGREIREDAYMHWWTFLGLFGEIGEGTFSTIVSIRSKRAKRKKLDDWEKEFYRDNKDMVDLKKPRTQEDIEAEEELNRILMGD